MIEVFAVAFVVVILLGVIVALGAMGAFFFLALLLMALFLSKTLLVLLTLLGVIAIPYLILRTVVRLCRGRTIPGTSIPVGAVVAVLALVALFAVLPSSPPKLDLDFNDWLKECDGPGADITINGKHYHFSCHTEDAPAGKDGLSM